MKKNKIAVLKEGVLLSKTSNQFESEGVLNPAVIMQNGKIHLFYRALNKGNFSSIAYARLSSPLVIEYREDRPRITPHYSYESFGIEDPRIVAIDNLFYLSYTAYNGINALGAYATSSDLVHFEKKGLMVPQINFKEFNLLAGSKTPLAIKYVRYNSRELKDNKSQLEMLVWDKNVIFFPRRINGKICFIHRIKPDIQFVAIDSMDELCDEFWHNYLLHMVHHILLKPKFLHEVSYIGGGCPPIETDIGWLLIYHGVYDTIQGYVYCACAALLDLNNPQIELARLPYPLFEPSEEWEKQGMVNNVCFPSGAIVIGDTLFIYYGAADDKIACASLSLNSLLTELINFRKLPN